MKQRFIATWKDGTQTTRTSHTRTYTHAWRLRYTSTKLIAGLEDQTLTQTGFSGDAFNARPEVEYRARNWSGENWKVIDTEVVSVTS